MNISQVSLSSASFNGRNQVQKALRKAVPTMFSPCEFPLKEIMPNKGIHTTFKDAMRAHIDRYNRGETQKGFVTTIREVLKRDFKIGGDFAPCGITTKEMHKL